MKIIKYILKPDDLIDPRDLVTLILGIKLRESRSQLYVTEFIPNLLSNCEKTLDDLAYGKVTSPSQLNVDALLRDFSSTIQIDEMVIIDSTDHDKATFELSIEDSWILGIAEDDEKFAQKIDNVLGKLLGRSSERVS